MSANGYRHAKARADAARPHAYDDSSRVSVSRKSSGFAFAISKSPLALNTRPTRAATSSQMARAEKSLPPKVCKLLRKVGRSLPNFPNRVFLLVLDPLLLRMGGIASQPRRFYSPIPRNPGSPACSRFFACYRRGFVYPSARGKLVYSAFTRPLDAAKLQDLH